MKKQQKIILLLITIITFFNTGFSQGEFWNWHFGNQAGLNFPGGGNPVPFTNSALSTAEGSATISDKFGNLLFYTDGIRVWDKNNIQMPNGFGLMGNSSSCQSAVIVPRPGSATEYYIFTTPASASGALMYSVVNMTLNGGNGDIVAASKNTLLYTPTTERLTAVKHKNGCDIWVLSHHWGSANIYAYLVTAAGVNTTPVISNPGGQVHNAGSQFIGYMKVNPQGDKVAVALAISGTGLTSSLELYDFNNATGVCSNAKMLNSNSMQTYGCEFSPNGNLLYGTCGTIYQYDVTLATTAAINASRVTVGNGSWATFQCAPNGKMYQPNGANLNVINNPNVQGMGCNFALNAVNLAGKSSVLGLPSFITSWVIPPVTFSFTPNCTTTFTISDTSGIQTVSWNFGDPPSGAANTSTLISPSHMFTGPGTYTVQLIINYACKSDTVSKPVTVVTPSLAVQTTSATCTNPGSATVTVIGGTAPFNYTWSPSAQTSSVAMGLSAGIYSVTVVDNSGCIKTETLNVGSNNPMTGVFTTTNVLCYGGNTGITNYSVSGGSGNYSYSWSNGQTTQTANSLPVGVYTVTVQDLDNPCNITATVQITQPPALSLTVNSNTTNVCAGLTINANALASGGTAPYNYSWTPGPATSFNNISETVAGNYVYNVNVLDNNGCVINGNINLTFNPIPVITVTSNTICLGGTGVLNANGANSYVWMPGNYVGNTYTSNATSNQYFTIIGSDPVTGCTSLPVTATLAVNPLPSPQIMTSKNNGCVPLCMTFTANNSTGSISYVSWDFGDGSFTSGLETADRCFNISGNYVVTSTVTDINGCVSTATTSLEAYPIPTADFNYAPLKPIVNNAEVTFTDASYNAKIAKWDWYFMNLPKPHSDKQNPAYMYTEAGTYAVALYVTSEHGCVDTIVKTLIVGEDYGIFVPNAFTPNGDGINDVFQPKGFGVTKYELRVFNRWGEQLMFTNNFEHGWDGIYKGKLSEEGTYVWKINVVNVFGKSHELSGHVTLMK